jgi:hypothetical protein
MGLPGDTAKFKMSIGISYIYILKYKYYLDI